MTDLDEMERLASRVMRDLGHPPNYNGIPAVDLARAVLAVLPVVRAAMEWGETEAIDLTFEPFARDHLASIGGLKRAIERLADHRARRALRCLAANLAMAGGLCAAYQQGWGAAVESETTDGASAARSTYTNPIMSGDWSDPGLIRVGGDYYSVRSTFGWRARAADRPLTRRGRESQLDGLARWLERIALEVGQIAEAEHLRVVICFDQLLVGVALGERSAGPGDKEQPVGPLTDQPIGIRNRAVLGKPRQLVAAAEGDQLVKDIFRRAVVAVHGVMVLADEFHVFVPGIPIRQVRGSAIFRSHRSSVRYLPC